MTIATRDCQLHLSAMKFHMRVKARKDTTKFTYIMSSVMAVRQKNLTVQLFCGFSIPIPRAHTHTNTQSVARRVVYKPRTASQGEGLVVAWWPQRVCQRNSLHFSPVSASNSHFLQHEVSTSQCSQRLERQTLALNGGGPGSVGVRGCRAERLTPSMPRLKGCTYS